MFGFSQVAALSDRAYYFYFFSVAFIYFLCMRMATEPVCVVELLTSLLPTQCNAITGCAYATVRGDSYTHTHTTYTEETT